MFRSNRCQALVVLAAGALLGYLAASGASWPNVQAKGNGASPSTAQTTEAGLLALAQAEQAEEVITFEVRLPANAVLEIDDQKTQETGEVRPFQTPPLKVGGRYNYTLKATAGGKTVTRSHPPRARPDHLRGPPAGIPGSRWGQGQADGTRAKAWRQQEAQHPVHHGRRHRLDAAGLLPPRPDGRRDAEHRPDRPGGRHVHGLLRRCRAAPSGRCAFVTGHVSVRVGHDPCRSLPGSPPACDPAPRASPSSCSTWATPPASSARTTSAITPTPCRRRTASRNSGATCTTSTPCSR